MNKFQWLVAAGLLLLAGCDRSANLGDPAVKCGAGTAQQSNECVATSTAALTCGQGTREESGTCVPDSIAGLTCGTGTTREGTRCVGDISCGTGTRLTQGKCVPTAAMTTSMTCGAGTAAVGSECRVDMSAVCGTDTMASNNGTTCSSRVKCGAGTVRNGDNCVADTAQLCGMGTTWSGTHCVASAPEPSFATFSARTAYSTGFFDRDNSTTSNNLHSYRFVATDLSQGTAEGWSEVLAPLVGNGGAVHVKWNHNTNSPVSLNAQTIPVRNASGATGKCLTNLTANTEPNSNIDGTYVNFFGWNATTGTALVCGIGGTIGFARESTTPERIRMTFNVQFSDGSSWINKVLYATYRKGT